MAPDKPEACSWSRSSIALLRRGAIDGPVQASVGAMANIVVPQLGESVVEARVARWLKKEGDRVETGEPVVELETDKIDVEVGADHAGTISSIKHGEGDDVKVGELLAVVDELAAEPPPRAAATPAPAQRRSRQRIRHRATSSRARPARRRRTIRPDGERFGALASGNGSPNRRPPGRRSTWQPAAPSDAPPTSRPTSERSEERVRMSKRRQTIARRLVEAQHTAAMLTTFNEVDMTVVMALRETTKESFKKEHGVGLGIVSFFVKAIDCGAASVSADQRRTPGRRDRRSSTTTTSASPSARRVDSWCRCCETPTLCRFRRSRSRSVTSRHARTRNADARRPDGRNVHDHQRRRLRIAAQHADPESAASRDPRSPQDPGPRRAGERSGRRFAR